MQLYNYCPISVFFTHTIYLSLETVLRMFLYLHLVLYYPYVFYVYVRLVSTSGSVMSNRLPYCIKCITLMSYTGEIQYQTW